MGTFFLLLRCGEKIKSPGRNELLEIFRYIMFANLPTTTDVGFSYNGFIIFAWLHPRQSPLFLLCLHNGTVAYPLRSLMVQSVIRVVFGYGKTQFFSRLLTWVLPVFFFLPFYRRLVVEHELYYKYSENKTPIVFK